ncbi:MAG TPA: MoxR family ATPase [Anaerolineae bacterium]|nr:MoxR family ATPase [Anaerolineae bacterium]
MIPQSIHDLDEQLTARNYIADHGLVTAIFLSLKLNKPLFLEGEAGVGKTEIAKVLADVLDTELIRLQCYEGLDINHAVYEWNYARQLLELRAHDSGGVTSAHTHPNIFSAEFLIKRPLLQAIEDSRDNAPVLLIDEVDRSDTEFEAYLLELLSDWQITIPELGTLKAAHPPVVVITSNRTRELHDALKRRCIYYWIEYPNFQKELAIVRAKVPQAQVQLAAQVVAFIQELRGRDLYKMPGVAETLDWASALAALDQTALSEQIVNETLGVILKYQDDVEQVRGGIASELTARAKDYQELGYERAAR